MLVFPTYYLRSVGMAATATVLAVGVQRDRGAARTAGSAGQARRLALGHPAQGVGRFPVLASLRRGGHPRRPLLYALPVVAALLALGIPFLHAQYATPDERALPTDSSARLVAESLQHDFQLDPSQATTLVTRNDAGVLAKLAADVSGMDGVVLVNGPVGRYEHGQPVGPTPAASGAGYLSVQADSDQAQHLVRDIRAKITGHQVEVGGPTAH